MYLRIKLSCFFLLLFTQYVAAQQQFPIVTKNSKAVILYDAAGAALDSIAAHLLSQDIANITGYKPEVINDISAAKGNVIVIGTVQSSLVKKVLGNQSAVLNQLNGKWECYSHTVVQNPIAGVLKALVITGSDVRGMAYGVFSLSEELGVSPWYWWADVPAKKRNELIVYLDDHISNEPAVKYRGIFLNDEDWGLRPWAAQTFEPAKKNIGPKTYAKIFELLLRLKANLIWPAMHPGTEPFYQDERNAQMANAYSIVVGTSHAEPMMRNNVGEWDEKTMGRFNYITNKQKVYDYWESRVKQTAGTEVIYSLGMRGVHDSGMEGVKDAKDAIPLVEQIMKEQRGLLEKYNSKDATAIPQAFTAYKEVLDIYDKGLKIPDDVTFVWPDDNYGYIHRLNNEEEKKRAGGTGVYYHASYWGRPHDYLWLNSANPALMRHEMMKAYEAGANRIWVVNVGDIKPLEYAAQLFLDMAYDATPFVDSKYSLQHLLVWHFNIFGKEASPVAEVMWKYYELAFERRPEFMGWSQTEPTTKTKYTDYNHFYFGDEAQRRIDSYNKLQQKVTDLRKRIDVDKRDAFYQLVYYPVVGASLMNKKFLYRDKASLYAKQNRIAAHDYAQLSKAVYDSIITETKYFNKQLSNGKWNGMMSMMPRDLPVFLPPDLPTIKIKNGEKWNVSPEGYDTSAYINNATKELPVFTAGLNSKYFIDIFLNDSAVVSWNAKPSANWISLSQASGKLEAKSGKTQQRVWVTVDWNKAPQQARLSASVVFSAVGKQVSVAVNAERPAVGEYHGFAESNGLISIPAARVTEKQESKSGRWTFQKALGHSGIVMRAVLNGLIDTTKLTTEAPYLIYDFWSFSTTQPKVLLYTLPTHPLNNKFSMRYGVSIDGGPMQIVDFKTVGRSEEWKQNVLRNSAISTLQFSPLKPGLHKLTIYAIDPEVVLDRILINFGNRQKPYSVVPETYK